MPRTALQRTFRLLLALLGLSFLVLLATGLWLIFRYQPSGSFLGASHESVIRVAHRVTSTAFVTLAVATFGLAIAVSFERALRRGTPAFVVGLLALLVALLASFSGYLLPWDELALAPVARGEFRGFGFLFGHSSVRFVLMGSVEVGKDTVYRWFLVHTIATPVALVVVGVAAWRVTRRARVAAAAGAAGEAWDAARGTPASDEGASR